MNKLIPSKERVFWLSLLLVTAVFAENVGQAFYVRNSAGAEQIKLDTDGSVKAKTLKKFRAGANFITEASDGTDIGGFTEYGTELLLDSGNSWGSVAAPAAANDTHTISVTFDNAEGDTVDPNTPPGYEIFLTTRGVTSSAGVVGPPFVGDRYAGSFQIINPSLLGSGVTFVWRKTRTSNISP